MEAQPHHHNWHIPFKRDHLTLRAAYDSLRTTGAEQGEVPLMVQLVENPKYRLPGFELFHGAVDLRQHDYIHIILGRGLLEMDEAFTIGFTMGSTKKVTTTEETLFSFVAQYLYPKFYQFTEDHIDVFRNAARLAYISNCQPLDELNFDDYLDLTIKAIRMRIGLESDLILAYYGIEQRRYPLEPASQRLLSG
jgi:hypothetical protein